MALPIGAAFRLLSVIGVQAQWIAVVFVRYQRQLVRPCKGRTAGAMLM